VEITLIFVCEDTSVHCTNILDSITSSLIKRNGGVVSLLNKNCN